MKPAICGIHENVIIACMVTAFVATLGCGPCRPVDPKKTDDVVIHVESPASYMVNGSRYDIDSLSHLLAGHRGDRNRRSAPRVHISLHDMNATFALLQPLLLCLSDQGYNNISILNTNGIPVSLPMPEGYANRLIFICNDIRIYSERLDPVRLRDVIALDFAWNMEVLIIRIEADDTISQYLHVIDLSSQHRIAWCCYIPQIITPNQ